MLSRKKVIYLQKNNIMKNFAISIPLWLLILFYLSGCNSNSLSISPKQNLCSFLATDEFINRIYKYTLIWSSADTDAYMETMSWYVPKIEQIIQQIKTNCSNDSVTVYPFKKIDRVVFYNNTIGIWGTELNKEQTIELLSIINNPLNFGWAETTFETEKSIVFESDGKKIATLKIMDNTHIISTPQNILMKAGFLNEQGRKKITDLLKSI